MLIDYLQVYLQTRFCKYADKIEAGVPQGCCTSMLLYNAATNDVITRMAEKYKVVAYADDILIGHDPRIDPKDIIAELRYELAKLGLAVAEKKCKTTANGGTIEYLGQEFKQDEPMPLSTRLNARILKEINHLSDAPATNHNKYLLLRSVVIPRVNYGPLIEVKTSP